MINKSTTLAFAAAVMALGMMVAAPSATAVTIALSVPQSTAFSVLGHSCGGIQEKSYATGFDLASGYPTGDVYLSTKCGGSGRGGGYHTTTYSAWVETTWDFTGALVSYQVLSVAPTVDPTLTAFDANGNEVYNVSGSAFLALAPGFVPAPRVTGISVTSGPAAGGTTLTITGTGFTGAADVSFGSTAAASFTINSDNSITAVSPAANPGTVDVTVTSAGGTSATSASDQFTFVAAPVVSGISPTSGSVHGGTTVTITGSGFTDAFAVYFGGNPTGFSVDSDSSITATSPPGEAPDTVDVTVASLGGTSARSVADRFEYVIVVPTVTSISPSSGSTDGGTEVMITGANLGSAYAVSFGGLDAAGFIVNDDTSITALSPAAAAGPVDITVTTLDGTTATSAADLFTYGAVVPTVTSVSPSSGPPDGGTAVTITGSNLTSVYVVSFGGSDAPGFTVINDTSITVLSPAAAAGTVDVTATTLDGTTATSAADLFTYLSPAPTVTGLSPISGPSTGGTTVAIQGTNLGQATAVSFGGRAASSFMVNGDTSITAVSPSASTGTVDVTVTTPGGTSAVGAADRFTYTKHRH